MIYPLFVFNYNNQQYAIPMNKIVNIYQEDKKVFVTDDNETKYPSSESFNSLINRYNMKLKNMEET